MTQNQVWRFGSDGEHRVIAPDGEGELAVADEAEPLVADELNCGVVAHPPTSSASRKSNAVLTPDRRVPSLLRMALPIYSALRAESTNRACGP